MTVSTDCMDEELKSFQRNKSLIPLHYLNSKVFTLNYTNISRDYHQQYSSIYYKRLQSLRERVLKTAKEKWNNKVIQNIQIKHVEKVLDIPKEKPCWVIGLTYCEMEYKPNVLQEVAIGVYGIPPPPKPTYSNPDKDVLILEDESGRVVLDLSDDKFNDLVFVTGCVIGVLGIQVDIGLFKIIDIIFPSFPIQRKINLLVPSSDIVNNDNNKIAIISGLEIDLDEFDIIKMEILKEYLLGYLGNANQIKNITKLIIAGNSTKTLDQDSELRKDNDRFKYGTKAKSNYNSKAMNILDEFLSEILTSLPIDIMPGEFDPTEVSLPQQSLHKIFFNKSKKYIKTGDLRLLTNPAWFEIDNLRILGTSGQNINDILKYNIPVNKIENSENGENNKNVFEDNYQLRKKYIKSTLYWSNIIPTAPDTLSCYPYFEKDPFTLNETPHVYFIGNQPEYGSEFVKLKDDIQEIGYSNEVEMTESFNEEDQDELMMEVDKNRIENGSNNESNRENIVRIISVPKFKASGEIVLLDTKTLETEIIRIS
ncbi:DNA-directed DNA polymerase delta subunit POL31 ASCRUDRAFT_76637 [Ascoidea rubescens DSM 1968]|uniref:DNA-directed DNA polymerase n=1 Tax=Ascoidea rubescens DSM 1968 TaxID=1344418 RepID=A0A1D2VEL8_9ASCO|nr:hypothetical protein ASCRUDRAFT_76637 [Ascoidea rubescens DSM 1968]ODV60124.1 hypothetical protein ASCRUDRAFT_76637 [Ascoidea rubescens DSM 1968]